MNKEMSQPRKSRFGTTSLAYLDITGAIFFWATLEMMVKLTRADISAISLNFFRFTIGGFVLLLFVIFRKRLTQLKYFFQKYWKYYIPSALFGLAIGMFLYSYGIHFTKAAVAASIISANPIFISTYMIIFQGEKAKKWKIIGIIVGFLGVLIIITQLNFTDFFNSEYLYGNIMVLLGTLFWCTQVIIGKLVFNRHIQEKEKQTNNGVKIPEISSLEYNTITFLVTGILNLPFLFIPNIFQGIISQTWNSWLALLFLGLFPAGLAYLLFFRGLEKLDASKGTNIFYLKPIFATILAFIFLNEIPSIYFYLGMVIEVIALYLIAKK